MNPFINTRLFGVFAAFLLTLTAAGTSFAQRSASKSTKLDLITVPTVPEGIVDKVAFFVHADPDFFTLEDLRRYGGNIDIIADARMGIEQARLLTLKTAWMMDHTDPKEARIWISMIKTVVRHPAGNEKSKPRERVDFRASSSSSPRASTSPVSSNAACVATKDTRADTRASFSAARRVTCADIATCPSVSREKKPYPID